MNKKIKTALYCCNNELFNNLDKIILDSFFCIENLNELDENVSTLIVLGGDGTILKSAKVAAKFGIKVIGVNFGKLGFLTQLSTADDLIKIIKKIEELPTIKHQMLLCKNNKKEALNEFVIESENFSPIELKLYIDDTYVNSFKGNGLIIATPTGSTAYSMSAGGPILDPKVNAILITPLAIHSFNSRPIVISNKAKIKIEIISGESSLIVDGEEVKLKSNLVEFEESKSSVDFIDIGENFYSKMFLKLGKYNN